MSRAMWVRDTLIAAGYSVEHADRAMAEVKAEHFGKAAQLADGLRQFKQASGPRWSAQVSENVGILRVADQLRAEARLLAPAAVPVPDETAGDETGEAYPGELAHLRDLLRGVGRLADKQPKGNPLTELLIDHYSDSRMVDAQRADIDDHTGIVASHASVTDTLRRVLWALNAEAGS